VPESRSFSYDVFLSHNSRDKPRVRRLAERLRDAGLRVFFDEWVIKPGDDIYLAIERGLNAARVQVLCLSPAALESEWVALERSTVLFRDPTNADRRFIPLLLADCDLPDTLRRYQYVDWRDRAEAAFDELLTACRVPVEEAPVASAPNPAKKARVTRSERPVGKQRAASHDKTQPGKPPEQAEPLAVQERRVQAHEGWVYGLTVSPDGTWAASASGMGDDTTVKVWDMESGKCRATLKTDQETPAVAIGPDGKRILSGSMDHSIRVWDAVTGLEMTPLKGHTSRVWSVIALQDNTRALSGGWDKTLRVWDLASGSCLKTIQCGPDNADDVFGSAVNPAGTQAVSGHRNGWIRLWNLETGECLATMKAHSHVIISVQVTPDGRFAVSGSGDRTVKIWDLGTGTCVGTLEGHEGYVRSVAISPDGALIASTGLTDSTVRLWDWKAGACLQVINLQPNDFGCSVAFAPTGLRLLVGTAEGESILTTSPGSAPGCPPRRRAAT
jgi:WD40 repeat protein